MIDTRNDINYRTGRIVGRGLFSSFNISHLAKGVYLVRLKSGTATQSMKFVY